MTQLNTNWLVFNQSEIFVSLAPPDEPLPAVAIGPCRRAGEAVVD
jgi:hypothetical protein